MEHAPDATRLASSLALPTLLKTERCTLGHLAPWRFNPERPADDGYQPTSLGLPFEIRALRKLAPPRELAPDDCALRQSLLQLRQPGVRHLRAFEP